MRKIINYFIKNKKRFVKAGTFTALTLAFISCLHLRAVYFPEVVEPNSTFEVKLVADMKNPLNESVGDHTPYGFVGVLLPVGWTIDDENISYEYISKDNISDTSGKMFFSEEMTEHCNKLGGSAALDIDENWEDNYYWLGFKTDKVLDSNKLDSVVVVLNVTTNDILGDYKMLIGIQETSYEDGETLNANKSNLFFEDQVGSDEYSKKLLNIKVKEGDDPGTNTSVNSKEYENTYTVSSLGDGRLFISLQNEPAQGAAAIIYDINGRQVATQGLSAMENILDVKLSQGIYFVAVQKDGIRSSKKVSVK